MCYHPQNVRRDRARTELALVPRSLPGCRSSGDEPDPGPTKCAAYPIYNSGCGRCCRTVANDEYWWLLGLFAQAHLQAQRVEVHVSPVLHEFAVFHPKDVDELEFHTIASWQQVPDLPKVSSAQGLAGGHQVPFRKLLVDLHRGIREGLQQHPEKPLKASGWARRRRYRVAHRVVMVHEVRVEYLVGGRDVVLVLTHLHEVRHHPFVVLD